MVASLAEDIGIERKMSSRAIKREIPDPRRGIYTWGEREQNVVYSRGIAENVPLTYWTLDGPKGVGKSTTAQELVLKLEQRGVSITQMREMTLFTPAQKGTIRVYTSITRLDARREGRARDAISTARRDLLFRRGDLFIECPSVSLWQRTFVTTLAKYLASSADHYANYERRILDPSEARAGILDTLDMMRESFMVPALSIVLNDEDPSMTRIVERTRKTGRDIDQGIDLRTLKLEAAAYRAIAQGIPNRNAKTGKRYSSLYIPIEEQTPSQIADLVIFEAERRGLLPTIRKRD